MATGPRLTPKDEARQYLQNLDGRFATGEVCSSEHGTAISAVLTLMPTLPRYVVWTDPVRRKTDEALRWFERITTKFAVVYEEERHERRAAKA